MGVKGLWKLIEESGVPVPLESLEHKILAVDVSIWLHQAVKGFRGAGGEAIANSHLLTLFHRICKLLFYRIRPVFIFDGGVPQLKKQTLSYRRVRREAATNRAQKVRERLLNNLLQSHAVRNALGKAGPAPTQHRVLPAPKPVQKDMFELTPLPPGDLLEASSVLKSEDSDESESDDEKPRKKKKVYHYKNMHNFDLESEEFLSLPLQKRHEILVELQDSRKDNSWANINQMPSELTGFSSYQMGRLLKRSKFQETVDNVRSAIQKEKSEELERELFGNLEKHVSLTHKIASEDATHSIVIMKNKIKEKKEISEIKQAAEEKVEVPMSSKSDLVAELFRKSIIEDLDSSNSECDTDDEIDENVTNNDRCVNEKDALLQVMNYVMEDDNGLTQYEIMNLIKQSTEEVDNAISNNFDGEPSTSGYNADVANSSIMSSDSDDDFIEVLDTPEEDDICVASDVETQPMPLMSKSDNVNNVEAIRASNSSSLYIKIVQQRLDDIIHEEDASPKKAAVDSRKRASSVDQIDSLPLGSGSFSTSPRTKQKSTEKDLPKFLALTVAIDPLSTRVENDIFADIFHTNNQSQNISKETVHSVDDQAKLDKISVNINNPVTKDKVMDVTFLPKADQNKKCETLTTERSDHYDKSEGSDLQQKVNELVKLQLQEILNKSSFSPNLIKTAKLKEREILIDADVSTVPDLKDTENNANFILGEQDELGSVAICKSSQVQPDECLLKPTSSVSALASNSGMPTLLSKHPMTTESSSDIDCQVSGNSSSHDSVDQSTVLHSETPVELSPVDKINITADDAAELKKLELDLFHEQKTLVAQVQKVDRVASNLSQQMYIDAQDLLKLFGLPYLVAPMEAEAQCAFLDDIGLTNGTITDDSDAFLFGSKHIYKNFFNQSQHVELYKLANVEHKFGLTREKLITLALLTGSDYTEGIEGIGAVSGMEILSEFPGQGIELLKNFKKWWASYNNGVSISSLSKTREKMGKVFLPEGFPNEAVYRAYTEPTIDESREKFSWSMPNIEALREFTADKLGWNRVKTDDILIPIMKRMSVKSSQTRIDTYLNKIRLVKEPKFRSKRLQDAISKSKGEIPSHSSPTKVSYVAKIKKQHEVNSKRKKRDGITKDSGTSRSQPNGCSSYSSSKDQQRSPKVKEVAAQTKAVSSTMVLDTTNNASGEVAPKTDNLTKEDKKKINYMRLLKQKDEIAQKKTAEADMRSKKQQAALVLKLKNNKKKK